MSEQVPNPKVVKWMVGAASAIDAYTRNGAEIEDQQAHRYTLEALRRIIARHAPDASGAEARGRAEERAAIVAWLRVGTAITNWRFVAEKLERGDHLPKAEGTNGKSALDPKIAGESKN